MLKPIRYVSGSDFLITEEQLDEWRAACRDAHSGRITREQWSLIAVTSFTPLLDHLAELEKGNVE